MPYLQKQIVNGQVVPGPYLAGNPALLEADHPDLGHGIGRQSEIQRAAGARAQALRHGPGVSVGLHVFEGHVRRPGLLRSRRTGRRAPAYMQNLYDRRAEWGPTYFDNKHNFTGSFVYELPFGHKKKFGDELGAGRRHGAGRLADGRHLHRAHRLPADHQGDRRSLRHRRAQLPRQRDRHAATIRTRSDRACCYLDPKALFRAAGRAPSATPGVGIVRGPGMSRFDLSLNKQFRVTREEVVRTPAWGVQRDQHARSSQAPASLVITAPTFGQIRSSQGERNVQMVAKFYF